MTKFSRPLPTVFPDTLEEKIPITPKNQKELKQDFNEIIKTQKPMLQTEHWNLNRMDYQLKNSLEYPDPQIEFNPVIALKPQVEQLSVVQPNQPTEPKNDNYDFGSP